MKLTFTATVEKFDQGKYKQAVNEAVRKCFMKGGQKFLLASIPKVPQWTGMARGAFRNAEDLFGKVTNDAQSGGVRIRTTQNKTAGSKAGRGGGDAIRAKFRRGYFYKPPGGAKIERTPQAGRQFATKTTDILEVSGAALASGNTSYYFRFEIDISYFDKFDREKWNSFKAGQDALEEYVKNNLVLPDPLKYMTRKLIK
jgi:hypothetical protein